MLCLCEMRKEPSGPQKRSKLSPVKSESLKILPVGKEASKIIFPQVFPRHSSGENSGKEFEAIVNQASAYLYVRTDKYNPKTGLYPLYLQVSINGKYFKVSLYISIPKDGYDFTHGKIVGKKYQEEANQVNEALGRASRIFQQYNYSGRYLNKEIFLDEFSRRINLGCFCSFFENKLEDRYKLGLIAKPTYTHNKTVLKLLREFRPGELPFAEISERLMLQFKQWNERRLKKKAKNSNREQINGGINRIGKILATVKIYIRLAESDGIRVANPFKNGIIKIRQVKGQRHSLKKWEYDALVNLFEQNTLPSNEHEVLRAFLFCCNTSLAISDLKEFNKYADVRDGKIHYTRTKNKRFGLGVTVPLSDLAKRYMPTEAKFIDFPDQHYNDLLKHIAMKAKVDTWLTFHVARHTFATMFLAAGNQIQVLKDLMGHSKIATTEIYVSVAEEWKVEQINKMGAFMRVA